MIVKVQISQFNSQGITSMYIYNEDRSVEYEGEATEDILTIMNGSPKGFFKATLTKDKKGKGQRIKIIEKADWQNW